MSYGTIKVNTITFTNNGVDQSVTVSGLVASTSGNLTATGTISGSVIQGGTLVSGATVTGAAGQFTNLTSISGVFTTQVSGATVTGNVGQFTSLTGISAGFTTVTGTTVTGTTANFVTVSGTTVTGTTANFVTLSGTTVTGTTASFTSGVFTNVSGGVYTITSGVLAVGSVTNPSLSFNGDVNTGIYSPNGNAIGFATNGQARLVLDSDGQLEAASIGNASTPTYSFGTDPNTGMYSPGADQLAFSTNGTGRLFINSSGNVGIGTTSPAATLHSRSDNAGSGSTPLLIQNRSISANTAVGISFAPNTSDTADRSAIIYGVNESGGSGNATGLTFHTNANGGSPTERLRIDSSGKVGIGTTSPPGKLTVATTSADPISGLSAWGDGYSVVSPGGTSTSGGIGFSFNTTANMGHISCATPGTAWRDLSYQASTHRFMNGGSELVRIDSSGRLLIGTSSDSGGALLQVNGNRIRVGTAKTPASASDTGTAGEICWDTSYIYVCTATDTWKRAALSTW